MKQWNILLRTIVLAFALAWMLLLSACGGSTYSSPSYNPSYTHPVIHTHVIIKKKIIVHHIVIRHR